MNPFDTLISPDSVRTHRQGEGLPSRSPGSVGHGPRATAGAAPVSSAANVAETGNATRSGYNSCIQNLHVQFYSTEGLPASPELYRFDTATRHRPSHTEPLPLIVKGHKRFQPIEDRKGSPRCEVRTHSRTPRRTNRPATCWCRASGVSKRAGGSATRPPWTSAPRSTLCAATAASPGPATPGPAGTASSARPSAGPPPPHRRSRPRALRPARSASSPPTRPSRSSRRRRGSPRRRKSFDRAEVRPFQRVASAASGR